jgi:hypothetical protein
MPNPKLMTELLRLARKIILQQHRAFGRKVLELSAKEITRMAKALVTGLMP